MKDQALKTGKNQQTAESHFLFSVQLFTS